MRRALYAAHEAAIEERLTAQRLRAPLEHLEAGRSFAEQGGTSLDAARIARLYAELGVPLQRVVAILLQASTVGAAEGQLRAERQCTEADPLADCALAAEDVVGMRGADLNILFEGVNAKQSKEEQFNHRKTLSREEWLATLVQILLAKYVGSPYAT